MFPSYYCKNIVLLLLLPHVLKLQSNIHSECHTCLLYTPQDCDPTSCKKNKIKFIKTLETATAAGQNNMTLAGETVADISLRLTKNEAVCWKLGKCVVVSNLGTNILIGEPAKKVVKVANHWPRNLPKFSS